MKQYLKLWNKFDISLFILSIILIIGLGVYLGCGLLTISASFLGFFCALNQAKGHILGQFIGVLMSILYSILSYKNMYYGELIIYVFVILPMYIIGIFTWLKNTNKKDNTIKVNKINKKEIIILLLISILLFICLYYLLKYFNTNQLIVSTISMIINLLATYLIIRRSKYSFIFYIINAFILLILWGLPVLKGNILLLPMVFNAFLLLTNDIRGLITWSKKENN